MYGRIRHYPWPDHHPPPFRLIPIIMASMRNWLERGDLGLEAGREEESVEAGEAGKEDRNTELGEKDERQEEGNEPENKKDNIPNIRVTKAAPEPEEGSSVEQAKNQTEPLTVAPPEKEDNTKGSVTEGTIADQLQLKPEPTPPPADDDHESKPDHRVAVVHCKAGKGRSGTITCSYLISECDWAASDALSRFTERRMRPKFGSGVSIPSQVRWISYVERWKKGGKKYVDREIEIFEVRVWGMKDGVSVDVCGFFDDGKKILKVHGFTKEETTLEGLPMPAKIEAVKAETDTEGESDGGSAKLPQRSKSKREKAAGLLKQATDSSNRSLGRLKTRTFGGPAAASPQRESSPVGLPASSGASTPTEGEALPVKATLRPNKPIRVATSDVEISVQRREKTPVLNFNVVTSVAHVWFNAFFEGGGPESDGEPRKEGVFEIEWDAMDGVKGSSRRGVRALDRIEVVWRVAEGGEESRIEEPGLEESVPQMRPADWKGDQVGDVEPKLGLTIQNGGSGHDAAKSDTEGGSSARETEEEGDIEGVKASGPTGEEVVFANEKGGT